ncbi:MAG: sialate O-acetylesterase [Candidatus Izemoplasmatales bacterium]
MQNDFKLAIIFQDKMILQRNKKIKIFGECKKDVTITVKFLDYFYSFKTEKEVFCFSLDELPAIKESFNIEISSPNTKIVINDVLVGDVLICAGQSNMAFTVNESINVKFLECENIRSFEVPKLPYEGADKDFDWLYSDNPKWIKADKDSIKWFSSIGYLVATALEKEYDIPIGILSVNMGDTSVFTWTDEFTIKEYDKFNVYIDNYEKEYSKFKNRTEYETNFKKQLPLLMKFYDLINEGARLGKSSEEAHREAFKAIPDPFIPMGPLHQNRPSGLFNSMVKRVIPYPTKCILYYQGENDKLYYDIYKDAQDAFCTSWRKAFKDELPIVITQIAGYEYPDIEATAVAKLRVAQEKFIDPLRKKYLVSAADQGERFNIHPKDKNVVSRRFVNVLREFIYNDNENSLSPVVEEMIKEGNRLIIKTKYNDLDLKIIDKKDKSFVGITKDKQSKKLTDFYVVGKDLVINLDDNDYQEIRYGFVNYPDLFIYTKNDLPLLPFCLTLE